MTLRYIAPILLSTLLLLLQPLQEPLLFQRDLIGHGQFWRLWTGNFVHTNTWHLLLNVAGFWLLALIQTPPYALRPLMAQTVFIGTCTGLGLWFFSPDVAWYAGFSGILYGLFTLCGVRFLQQQDWIAALLILLGIVGKTYWDWLEGGTNNLSATLIAAPVVYDAHIYGIAAGLGLALLPARRDT